MEYAIENNVLRLPIAEISPFPDNPFQLYVGERFEDLTESIRTKGLLNPIIVRTISDGQYQILSGHNRVNACEYLGLDTIASINVGTISDEEALVYVIESNLKQRSFSELLPSEKAKIISAQYEKVFYLRRKNQVQKLLDIMSKPGQEAEFEACGTECHKPQKNRDILGEGYSLSGRNVANYLRLAKLNDELLVMLDDNQFIIKAGVEISYLRDWEQSWLADCLAQNASVKLDINKAKLLRDKSAKEKLDPALLEQILKGGKKMSTNKTGKGVLIKQNTLKKFFEVNATEEEIQETIQQALTLFFTNKQTNDPEEDEENNE